MSRRRDGDSDETGSSRDIVGILRRRRFITTVLTAIRYAVEKAESHSKRTDAAKHLQKSFLCQVFRLGYILRHQQAHGIDALLVKLEERGKGPLHRYAVRAESGCVHPRDCSFL